MAVSIIQQFHAELDTLIEIVQSVHKSFETCNQERAKPAQRLDSDRQELPQSVASAKLIVSETKDMVVQLQAQLKQLETDLTTQATSLADEGNRRVATMETATHEVQTLVHTLTESVGDALRETNACTADLGSASSKLLANCESDSTQLGQSSAPAVAALETSDNIVQSTYNPTLFNELASVLQALRIQLDTASTETLPGAVTRLCDSLAAEHTQGVLGSLQAFEATAQETQSEYLGSVQQSATQMRQEERTEVELTDKLASQELPQRARDATTQEAEPGMRQMTEETAKTWLVSGNMSAYLNKEQDPYLPAVRELHLALKGMLR